MSAESPIVTDVSPLMIRPFWKRAETTWQVGVTLQYTVGQKKLNPETPIDLLPSDLLGLRSLSLGILLLLPTQGGSHETISGHHYRRCCFD